jgi:hypothetical protein
MSFSPHLKTETDPISEALCFLVFLEIRIIDEVLKPSDSERYTPSPESFRF